jgi:3-hydroxyacyl-CoA dehydrogenase
LSPNSLDGNLPVPVKFKVAVIGAGSIGSAFTLMFAMAGHEVQLSDSSEKQRLLVLQRIVESLDLLQSSGLCDQDSEQVLSRIQVMSDVAESVSDVDFVQECVPEDPELKRSLFAELDRWAPEHAVLASSSSAITASEIAGELPGAHRCLVAHPGNPPFLIRVIEVVPAPITSPEIVDRTCSFMRSVGLSPIIVNREIKGFVFNRLQGALLREAYCLVRDGVASVEDIDRLVRDGLGLRWSVVGPFETVDLNWRGGIGQHAKIMGAAYAAMAAEPGRDDPWEPELVGRVEAERRAMLPLDKWDDRVRWRDRKLMAMLAAKLTDDNEQE